MKKLLILSTALIMLIITGCSDLGPTSNTTREINERDQTRKQVLHEVTYALGQEYRMTEKYPEASDNWCADDLIEYLKKTQHLKVDTSNMIEIKSLDSCKSNIYYFFRENNPDYYTFAIKFEGNYLGNSDLPPLEVAKLPLKDLKDIRLGGEEESATAKGEYYYIIGNYPVELLK